MPFTVSHIAAVLPFRGARGRVGRLFGNFPALAIGAVAPDFSYILWLVGPHFEAHTLSGLFFVAWPFALVGYVVYRRLLEGPWSTLLPWLRDRGAPHRVDSVLVGTLLGATTHVFLDAFTHYDGFFVELWPWLSTPFVHALNRNFAIYAAFQHAGGLIGGAFVVAAITHAIGKSPERRFTTSWRTCAYLFGAWLALSGAVLVVPIRRLLYGIGYEHPLDFWVNSAFRVLGTSILAMIGYAVLVRFQRKPSSINAS